MAMPCAAQFLLLACSFILSIRARSAGIARHKAGTGNPNSLSSDQLPDYTYADADSEATVLDFSDSPFEDLSIPSSIIHLAANDPYKANPKNGTPWFRYTKKSGRGQANHSHFGGLTAMGDFPSDMLRAHNVVRERAGVSPLKWSSELDKMASSRVQKLANEGCYIKHSPLSYRWRKAGFNYVGENLYKVINMKPSGVDIVDAWYAEIEDYTYGLVGSSCVKQRCAGRASPPCTLGHFTQVMWAASTHVGCARAECPGQAKRTFISICSYGPGGNIVGSYPFSALNSGKLGLATEDCSMRPRAQPSLRREAKHQEPSKVQSSAPQQLTNHFVMIVLMGVLPAFASGMDAQV